MWDAGMGGYYAADSACNVIGARDDCGAGLLRDDVVVGREILKIATLVHVNPMSINNR